MNRKAIVSEIRFNYPLFFFHFQVPDHIIVADMQFRWAFSPNLTLLLNFFTTGICCNQQGGIATIQKVKKCTIKYGKKVQRH